MTNRETIIRLAREAGASMIHGGEYALMGDAHLERFAALVAAAVQSRLFERAEVVADLAIERAIALEREACAELVDVIAEDHDERGDVTKSTVADQIAAAIRARSEA